MNVADASVYKRIGDGLQVVRTDIYYGLSALRELAADPNNVFKTQRRL